MTRTFRDMKGRSSKQFGNIDWETCFLAVQVSEWPQGSMGTKGQSVPSLHSTEPLWKRTALGGGDHRATGAIGIGLEGGRWMVLDKG